MTKHETDSGEHKAGKGEHKGAAVAEADEPRHKHKDDDDTDKDRTVPTAPGVNPLSTAIQASTPNPDGGTTTSASVAIADLVIECSCVNGTPGPNQPCKAILLMSADNINFVRVASEYFKMGAGVTSFARFDLRQYQGREDIFGLAATWSNFKVSFAGNIGAAVTVAAVSLP